MYNTVYVQCTTEYSICQTEYCAPAESCSAAVWHGTEHVSNAHSRVSTHLCPHFILKNYDKSKLYSNIVANLWVIEANYKSQLIEICTE